MVVHVEVVVVVVQTLFMGECITLNTTLCLSVGPRGVQTQVCMLPGEGGGSSVESAGQDRHTPLPEVLTTGLTGGGGAFGAGGRPLLVKMVVQVPGCGESRAHTLMERRSVWSQRERTDRQTGQRGGQSGEKQPLQESYRGTKTLPQSSVNHEQIRHYFSSSANPGETESSETERQKSWERRVCSQEIKHSGNNDIHPQRPKSAQTPEHHRSDWRLLITLVCLREKKSVVEGGNGKDRL